MSQTLHQREVATSSACWRIELFGGLRVRSLCPHAGDVAAPLTRFRTRKTASLLAYLACYPGPHPRDVLTELLWPDDALDDARHSLRTALSSLRCQFRSSNSATFDFATSDFATSPLFSDRASVGLHAPAFTSDIRDFYDALHSAARTRDLETRAGFWQRAVELHHSPLLPGFYESWAVAEEARASEAFFSALHALLEWLQARREWPLALDFARHGLAIDPSRSDAHRTLMRLLAASGAPNDAQRHFDALPSSMRRQIGAAPLSTARVPADSHDACKSSVLLSPTRSGPCHAATPPESRAETRNSGTVTLLACSLENSDGDGVVARDGVAEFELPRWRTLWDRELRRCEGRELAKTDTSGTSRENADNARTSNGPLFVAEFAGVSIALKCALAIREHTPHATIALFTGDAMPMEELQARTLELLQSAHAGQCVCSEAVAVLMRPELMRPETLGRDATLLDLGVYHLTSVQTTPTPERVFQLQFSSSEPHFPLCAPASRAEKKA